MKNYSLSNLLIGFSIGDAFGAGVEFQDREWIKENCDFTKFVNARALIAVENKEAFIENYSEWEYTDDTEMLIALLKLLIYENEFTENLVVKYIESEYNKGITDKGFGRNGHGSMAWYFKGTHTIAELKSFQQNRPNPGNAPTTRAVIIGLVNENLLSKYAEINSTATHPHPKAIASSIVIARATHFFLRLNGEPENLIDYCILHTHDEILKNHLLKINQLPDFKQLGLPEYELLCGKQPIEKPFFLDGINGLPSDALLSSGAILYILKYAKTPFEALKESILIGGDVDSLASVCTGILAAKYGLSSLPLFMQKNVEKINSLEILVGLFEKKYM